MAGAVDGLADGVEDLEGAVVGFLGGSFCFLEDEKRLVFFLGGSLGIFFFSSAIVWVLWYYGARWNARFVDVAGEVRKELYNSNEVAVRGDLILLTSCNMEKKKKIKITNSEIRPFHLPISTIYLLYLQPFVRLKSKRISNSLKELFSPFQPSSPLCRTA